MPDMNIDEFSAALASKSPTPGGGGAGALCASLAAALCSMAGALSQGKDCCAPSKGELLELTEKSEALRLRLLELIDEDAAAFSGLMKVYRQPKDAPEREKALLAAASVPMEILEKSCEAIELSEAMAKLCTPAMASDAGTAAVLAWGAMYAAALNVLVNTREMSDRARAAEMNRAVETLMDEYWKRADRTYEVVYARLRGN